MILVSQGCPKDGPAVRDRPQLGYFHQHCWNSLGFSDILAACLNRSLVREIDDHSWPKPPNAFRTGETGHPIGTPHGVNPTAQPNRGSAALFRPGQARGWPVLSADNSAHLAVVRKKQPYRSHFGSSREEFWRLGLTRSRSRLRKVSARFLR